jgi:hypothetical protein
MHSLFGSCAELPERKAWIITHDLGDITICRKIEELLKFERFRRDEIEVVENVLKVYEACRTNRNQLSHFVAHVSLEADRWRLGRRKGPSEEIFTFPDELKDIRRVADEIQTLRFHLKNLANALSPMSRAKRRTLPQTLPEPELLYQRPPQANPKPKRQPKPSRE